MLISGGWRGGAGGGSSDLPGRDRPVTFVLRGVPGGAVQVGPLEAEASPGSK